MSQGTSDRVAQITVPPERSYVGVARNFVGDVAAEEGWITNSQLADLRLAVSEAVTNAVVAETARGADDPILVQCATGPDRFEVRIRDHGGGFAVSEQAIGPADPDPGREGGYGLSLMVALVDEARFEEVDGGTEVFLCVIRHPGS